MNILIKKINLIMLAKQLLINPRIKKAINRNKLWIKF